jgi:hypothetical protein
MERDIFEDLKKYEFNNVKLRKNVKLCKFASWAIWKEDGQTNTDFIDNDEVVRQLRNNVFLLRLTPAAMNKLLNEKAGWKNFHAGTEKNPGKLSTDDRKLRNVLGESKYKGAYMTDIIDLFKNPKDVIILAWKREKRQWMPKRFVLSGCSG